MSDDMKLLLEKRRIVLREIMRSMDEVVKSFALDDEQNEVVSLIKHKANAELAECEEKLAPRKKAAKKERKRRKTEEKAAARKANAGLRSVNKKIREKNEKIHKVSKLNQISARFIQGGSPGLGKKS